MQYLFSYSPEEIVSNLLCRIFLPEPVVVFIANFLDHIQGLPDQLLLDDLEQLVLLESFTRHVQWQVVRIHLVNVEMYNNHLQTNNFDSTTDPLLDHIA